MPSKQTINDSQHYCYIWSTVLNSSHDEIIKQLMMCFTNYFSFLIIFFWKLFEYSCLHFPTTTFPRATLPPLLKFLTNVKVEKKSQNHKNISKYLEDCMKVQYFYVNVPKILSQSNQNNLPKLSSDEFKNCRRQALTKRKSPAERLQGNWTCALWVVTVESSPAPVAEQSLPLALSEHYTKCSIRGFCLCIQQNYYKTHKSNLRNFTEMARRIFHIVKEIS